MNAESFHQLDKVIHEKGRMAIMSMLAAAPELSFTELRDALGMTDGNLTTHIRTLQKAGYVAVAKSYQDNRPLTTCSLTASGRKAFGDYVGLLEVIVKQARKSEAPTKARSKKAKAAKPKILKPNRRSSDDNTNFAMQS